MNDTQREVKLLLRQAELLQDEGDVWMCVSAAGMLACVLLQIDKDPSEWTFRAIASITTGLCLGRLWVLISAVGRILKRVDTLLNK